MTTHTYPLIAVLGDYFRAVLGIGISIVPLVLVTSKPIITYAFIAMIVVFIGFGLRTVMRHKTRIEVDDEAIAVNLPSRRRIVWSDLGFLRLKYFSTRRNRKGGWLQMTMIGAGQRITVDSKIAGFRDLLDRATRAAAENGVELDETSLANMEAIGEAAV